MASRSGEHGLPTVIREPPQGPPTQRRCEGSDAKVGKPGPPSAPVDREEGGHTEDAALVSDVGLLAGKTWQWGDSDGTLPSRSQTDVFTRAAVPWALSNQRIQPRWGAEISWFFTKRQ